MEEFWYNCIPVFILMIECVAVFFFAGIRTVNEYIRKMTTWHVTLWYRLMWKIMIPLILVVSQKVQFAIVVLYLIRNECLK